MGIASDWARIKGNINAALAAIADKGVTVPSGSTSDALAELIASIEAGGGLPDGMAAIATGTYTPAKDLHTGAIEHGLGVTPSFFFMCADVRVGESDSKYIVMNYVSRDLPYFASYKTLKSYHKFDGDTSLPGHPMFSESSVTIESYFLNVQAFFGGGMQYRWIAGVWA